MKARLFAALIALAGYSLPIAAQEAAISPPPVKTQTPAAAPDSRIDVVFCLDTTGSMTGLIDGAKRKIWSIANQMATAKPAPKIRIGLLAYRDRGDEYITRLTPLSDDLDAIYSDLMKLYAAGGGDFPESVNQALNEAVTKFDWSKEPKTLRLIYLVGDAPPHMDYEQDVKYPESCKAAAAAGITINTIQCGNEDGTRPIWQEIARKAEGEYFQIEQNGGMAAIATPYDEELSRLGTELEKTVVAYGSVREQAVQTDKMAVALSLSSAPAARPEATADRAVYKASAAGRAALCGDNDLVEACQNKRVELEKLKSEDLNKDMQAMTPEQRKAFIDQKIQDRAKCQGQIAELNEKRQAFIKDKLAAAGGTKDSFDALVFDSLRRQGAKCGITYSSEKK
jgi:Mg-chelatase subunit ChlD